MTASLLGLALGVVLGWLAFVTCGPMLEVEPLLRSNYRDQRIPTGAGVLIPVCLLAVVAVGALWQTLPDTAAWGWWSLSIPCLVAALGASLLGLLDDIAGAGQSGGFGGHVSALRAGRVTSGLLKLVGGAALGVVVATLLPHAGGPLSILRDGASIALAANLVNLFDRAPGRAIKVGGALFVVTAVVARTPLLAVPGVGVGAAIGLLRPDLDERCMLGDAGSNALGALCGVSLLVAATTGAARWWVVCALLVANLLSEWVSFSSVIDSVPPLRWLDRLGSQRAR